MGLPLLADLPARIDDPAAWTARDLTASALPSAGTFLLLTAWAVVWCAVALAGYTVLRRGRA